MEGMIRPNTKAVLMLHASNVCGTLMPVEQVGQLCKKHGLTFILDAAQTAGAFPIDMEKMNIDVPVSYTHLDVYKRQVPELALYTHYIEDLLSQKEHILDERSEQMLVRMQDIHSSFKKIYTDLRINDTKNEEIADSQGNKLVVSDATYSAAMEHPDRAFRKEFFEKLLGTYEMCIRDRFMMGWSGGSIPATE